MALDRSARRSRRLWPAAVAALSAIGFVALAGCVEVRGSMPGDTPLLRRMTDAVGTRWDATLEAIARSTNTGPVCVAAVALAGGLALKRRLPDAAVVIVAVGAVVLVNPLLKDLFDRARPTVRPIPYEVSDQSFPSGHAANTAALAGAIVLASRRRDWSPVAITVALVAAVAVGVSQLLVGAHHPSDVIAGWLWVTAWTAALAAWPAAMSARRLRP